MPLSIIGSGFGRTGTMSLKAALNKLGFGPCHHMDEVIANPDQLPAWRQALRGGDVDWEMAFDGYSSAVDWPAAHYWEQLADTFPKAKIIHTTRAPEQWWASFSSTVGKVIGMKGTSDGAEQIRNAPELINEMIAKQTFGSSHDDKSAALQAFEKRDADVRSYPAQERILIFDVTEGWKPLCAFLSVPIPNEPFPHSNSREDFWALIKSKLG